MKPENVIRVGEINICETGENNIAIIPSRAAYDVDFSSKGRPYDYACIVHKCTDFLVKDADGIFHKFSGMTYCGTVDPQPSTEEMLKRLIEKFEGALVVTSKYGVYVTKDNKFITTGCDRLYKIIVNYTEPVLPCASGGVSWINIGKYDKESEKIVLKDGDVDFIQQLYKEHFPCTQS